MIRREKVYAYITHGRRLLVFRHVHAPEAGIQVPGGSLEPGEAPEEGVLREAREETGLEGLRLSACLGESEFRVPSRTDGAYHRTFYHLVYEGAPPERWRTVEETPSDGSSEHPVFEHYWVPLPDGVPTLAPGHDAFLPALIARLCQQ